MRSGSRPAAGGAGAERGARAERSGESEARAERDAESAARAFVADYIRFSRRALAPRRIRAAAPRVRRRLARLPFGRGTPALREHPPRSAGVRVVAADGRSVRVRALVERLGVRRPLELTLSRRGGRWVVVAADLHTD